MHAVAKFVGFFTDPLNLVVLLAAVGAVAALARLRSATRLAFATLTAILLVVGLTPLADIAMHRLETRFPKPAAEVGDVVGAVVLGGATGSQRVAAHHDTYLLGEAAERLTTAAALRRRFPDLPIVVAGFSASLRQQGPSEAEVTRRLMTALGFAADAFTYEARSRNTFENAVFTRALVGEPEGAWLLVTSAFHMPRAVGTFRRAGFDVVPYPVDFRTAPPMTTWWPPKPLDRFEKASVVAKEWVGLVAYRLLGRSDALLPAPVPPQPAS